MVGQGVKEIKTLYGADRKIDWSHLDFIDQQTTTLESQDLDIILQAFNMSYEYITEQLDSLAKAGYTIIQISPPQQALNKYGIWWESYQPTDHRVFDSRYGTESELRAMIKKAHELGIQVVADTVLNHMADPFASILTTRCAMQISTLQSTLSTMIYILILTITRCRY